MGICGARVGTPALMVPASARKSFLGRVNNAHESATRFNGASAENLQLSYEGCMTLSMVAEQMLFLADSHVHGSMVLSGIAAPLA